MLLRARAFVATSVFLVWLAPERPDCCAVLICSLFKRTCFFFFSKCQNYFASHKYCTENQNKNCPYLFQYNELRNKLCAVEKGMKKPFQRHQFCLLIHYIGRDMDHFCFGSAYNTYVEQSIKNQLHH